MLKAVEVPARTLLKHVSTYKRVNVIPLFDLFRHVRAHEDDRRLLNMCGSPEQKVMEENHMGNDGTNNFESGNAILNKNNLVRCLVFNDVH